MKSHSPSFEHRHDSLRRSTPAAVDPSTVLYARDGTIVTFRWLYADGVRYSVADLHDVTRSASPANTGIVSALAVAALSVVAAIGLAGGGDTRSALFVASLAAIALGAAVVLAARRRQAEYSLWARYGDMDVLLLTTRDARRFGQVARAVQRALEAVPRTLP